jgi:type IV pilus assembly protein PilW
LQAQYGVSNVGNSNQVVQWVDATVANGWAAPSVANRNRIKAIRVAVITRNTKIEPYAVTNLCSSITVASPTGLCAWDATSANPSIASPAPLVDLSPGNANWARYHYRVFETIIPLRNTIWSKNTL